ncbi:TonB-dependent receptor [Granulicella paludicola]|uniref:TonB-dependent receptor n=1 Tax=Granulicella paludicola TaxID=474951 RepID=UPI0021E0E3A3|nr:TonB-dependent receptor [Granulicella paludicola]
MTSIHRFSSTSTGQWTRTLRRIGHLVSLLTVLIFACSRASAQITTADIVGTVTDPTGALVPNAKVKLVNVDTHDQRDATSNTSGDFQFTLLPVGRYNVTVSVPGFKTSTISNVAVEAGDRARADVNLATGIQNETVTVEATTPLLQADNATVSSTVTAKAVQDLPLNGRNFVQLVQLVPGANEGPGNGLTSGGRPDDRRVSASFSVNGQDDTLNNYIIDGADDNERIIGTIGVRPNVEGIQEITVQTNSYSVEAGRTAGGVVSITTRSGTNQFHGSAYEYFRNDALDARNVLQRTGRKPELRQNQFGGSFGGPIIHDRTFFFGDYEGFRQVSGLTYSNTVPTADLYNDLNGLAGGTPQAIIAASNNGVATYCATVTTCIDPIALNYLKLYPAPTNSGQTNNEVISPSKTQYSSTADARVDHHFNSNNLMFARFSFNKTDTFTPPGLGNVGGFQISGGRYNFSGPATDKAYQYGLGYTHIFNQNLLLDLRATYTRINNLSLPLNYGQNADTKLGFGPNMNFNTLSNFLTPISFGSFPDIGDGAYVPLQDIDNTFQYSGTLSWTLGNHSVKVGAQLIRRQSRNVQSAFAAGQYGFGLTNDNATVANPGVTNVLQQTYINQLASSLVGAFTSEGRNYDIDPPDYRSWEPSGFALDSWKVSPKLTVQYGLRYDVFTPFTEAHNHISDFDFNKAVGSNATNIGSALLVAGQNGVSSTAGIKTDYSNVAPRIGFSYSVTPTIVVRGGYGLSYFPGNYTSNADLKNAPFVSVYSPSCGQSDLAIKLQTGAAYGNLPTSGYNSACFTAANDSTHTFDAGLPLPTPQSITSNALSFVAEDTHFRSALIQQYNLQVEKQFGANVFTIGYVGNVGQHLPETINDINQPAPFNPFATGASSAFKLAGLLPNLGSVGWMQSEGVSNYNALQTSFQRRFSHGLAFDANYTWAKDLSDITGFSEEGDQGWSNADPTRIRQIDYGIAENDIQNRFALSLNYELQFGSSFTGIKRAALHGWEINTITVWQSGKPISIYNGGNTDYDTNPAAPDYKIVYGNRATPVNSGGNDRPNKIASNHNPHTLTQWFNTSNYAPQALGTIGSAKRNSEFGPRFRHIDLSLFKDFALTQRYTLQFRAEAFDITNTPDYFIPNNNNGAAQLGSSTFGQAGNAVDPNYTPREVQFALKLKF